MRHYKNTVTGSEIFTECEIQGGDWVEIIQKPIEIQKEEPQKEPKKQPRKSGRKKES